MMISNDDMQKVIKANDDLQELLFDTDFLEHKDQELIGIVIDLLNSIEDGIYELIEH